MHSISSKIARPIIIAGIFVTVAFTALNYGNLTGSFYAISLLSVAYVFLFGISTGQNFAKSIKQLLKKAKELSSGNEKSRASIDSNDELGELAKVFNKMAQELQDRDFAMEELKKSTELKIQKKVEPLQETITALEQKIMHRTLDLQKVINDLEILKMQQNAAKPKPKKRVKKTKK